MILIKTPVTDKDINYLQVGDMIEISGQIYTGRDVVLPKLVSLIREDRIGEIDSDLSGGVIFHTAVSPAGVGPTSSNKLDIESNISELSKAGVKIHLGKGKLDKKTIEDLRRYNAIYAIIPPITALLSSKIKNKKIIAYPEEGMEALHLLEVEKIPAIVAIAHGKTIY